MGRIINLTPLIDDMITLKKGDVEISFPDRLPASMVPTLMSMQDDTGNLDLSAENVARLFDIIGKLIRRANPTMTQDDILDFLDVQDFAMLVSELLSPNSPSSGTEATQEAEPRSRASTRKPKS